MESTKEQTRELKQKPNPKVVGEERTHEIPRTEIPLSLPLKPKLYSFRNKKKKKRKSQSSERERKLEKHDRE